ncbi:MAG: hypothetical protein AAGG38_15040 [Planctomycetota bacterium]
MSTTTHRMTRRQAVKLAWQVQAQLRPGCERIEVAGSVRRKTPDVGDLEFVIVPKREAGLFGDASPGESLLDRVLGDLVDEGRLRRGERDGERQKQFVLARSGVKLDLFIVTPATWGVQLAIRTGPSNFSTALVMPRYRGGYLDDDLQISEGRAWRIPSYGAGIVDGTSAVALDTPEESDFLALAGGWVEPEDRR